jgi:hypothetical protein
MKTKELLKEWKNFLNEALILESKIDDIKEELVNSNPQKMSVEDWNFYINNPDNSVRNKLRKDNIFMDIVYNTIKQGKHNIYDIVSLFEEYLINISSQFGRGDSLYIDVPGGERIDLARMLEEKTASYDDIFAYLEAKKKMKLNKKEFVKCLKLSNFSENSGSNEYFDVIVNESSSDWIICYPKSIKGSIALARSYWNGNRLVYDTTFNKEIPGVGANVGSMTWCTSIDSANNMFLNYYRRLNLHMYYCIYKYPITNNENRKLCVSFGKKNKNVSIKEGSASVNANNNPIKEQEIKGLLGGLYNVLLEDVNREERLDISPKDYYESISFKQYLTLKKANLENINLFIPELKNIVTYSKDNKKIVKDLAYDDDKKLKSIGTKSSLLDKEDISVLLEIESDQDIIDILISNENCPFDKIINMSSDKFSTVYYKTLVSNKECPIAILSKVIKNEYDDKIKLPVVDYSWEEEEIEIAACLAVIKTLRYEELDSEAQLKLKSIIGSYADQNPDEAVEDFYSSVGSDKRQNPSVYKIFFNGFHFEMLSCVMRSYILHDDLFPDDILYTFFEKILPPLSKDPEGYATGDLDMDYIAVINHNRLPVNYFKNIYDLYSKSDNLTGANYYLELAKCKRVPNSLLKLLADNEDSEVRKAAEKTLNEKDPVTLARKDDITEQELIAISSGRNKTKKLEIAKRKDLNRFNIETTRIVLRNIIEAGKLSSKFMRVLSERDDLVALGLESRDLSTIYNFLTSEDDKSRFIGYYPLASLDQSLLDEKILRSYIQSILS